MVEPGIVLDDLNRHLAPTGLRFGPEPATIFDPDNRMNSGKVVAPAPLDTHLRLGGDWSPATPQDVYFRYPDDGGSFAEAANRCVGVGRCRQHSTDNHEVMCPSYQVTGEEEHSLPHPDPRARQRRPRGQSPRRAAGPE